MATRTAYTPGTPCWVDLGTQDVAASAAFYGSLFGWEAPEGPAEFGGYRMALLRGSPVAGIAPGLPGQPPGWSTYVRVDDVDKTLATALELGGTVVVDGMDVPGVGRMAVLTDPAGAAVSLWQPAPFPGAGVVNEPGSFSWSELVTRDIEGAKAFYGPLFGWAGDTQASGHSTYTEWSVAGAVVGGMLEMWADFPPDVPPHWAVYFAVEDTDATIARVLELGGGVVQEPVDIPQGRFAVLRDDQGGMFSVIAMTAG